MLESYNTQLSMPYADALARVKQVFADDGFGVLTEIDVKKTLKEKIGEDFRHYHILGLCNPPRAFQALQTELDIGLLLPCKVIVYEIEEGNVQVKALKPSMIAEFSGSDDLKDIAAEVDEMFHQAVEKM